MTFVADENVDAPVVVRLRNDGHKVLYIAELAPSIEDDFILDFANTESAVLLTNDKDFGELVFRQRRAWFGVILLRLHEVDPSVMAEIVASVVHEHGTALLNCFTVISRTKVRIRQRNS